MPSPLAANTAPLRGTQSFVGVMSEVWKRPILTALELSWRWAFWLVVGSIVSRRWWPSLQIASGLLQAHNWSVTAWTNVITIGVGTHAAAGAVRNAELFCAVCLVVWVVASAWGRGRLLRKLCSPARPVFAYLLGVSALRVVCFVAVVSMWVWGAVALTRRMVVVPQTLGQDPAFVPYAAIVICGTLGVFVLWMAASYVFQLAAVLSVSERRGFFVLMRHALRGGVLRSKLIEINLVIGIVKIALLVLAMVFSACPLPFSNVETQEFLVWWSVGVAVWWAVASDYFHVVRTAAFLRLWQFYENPSPATTVMSDPAS